MYDLLCGESVSFLQRSKGALEGEGEGAGYKYRSEGISIVLEFYLDHLSLIPSNFSCYQKDTAANCDVRLERVGFAGQACLSGIDCQKGTGAGCGLNEGPVIVVDSRVCALNGKSVALGEEAT
jgi:hypothetical protein